MRHQFVHKPSKRVPASCHTSFQPLDPQNAVFAGSGAARRVVSGIKKVGNTIQRVASKANQMTGGALDMVTDDIPGGAAVKNAFKAGLNVVNKADKALSRAEGAFQRGKK